MMSSQSRSPRPLNDKDNEGTMQPNSHNHHQLTNHQNENIQPQLNQISNGSRSPIVKAVVPTTPKSSSRHYNHGRDNDDDDDNDEKVNNEIISKIVATDLARQDHKDKVIAASKGAVMKQRSPPVRKKNVVESMEDVKRRERGPSISSAVVIQQRKPAPRSMFRKTVDDDVDDDDEVAKETMAATIERKEHRDPSPKRAAVRAPFERIWSEEKEQEEKQVMNNKNSVADQEMIQVKNREKKGPTISAPRATFNRKNLQQRGNENNNATLLQNSTTHGNNVEKNAAVLQTKAADQNKASIVQSEQSSSSDSSEDSIMEMKRRARVGPSTAAAYVSRKKPPPPPGKKLKEKETLTDEEIKRRAQRPQIASATTPAKVPSHDARKPPPSGKKAITTGKESLTDEEIKRRAQRPQIASAVAVEKRSNHTSTQQSHDSMMTEKRRERDNASNHGAACMPPVHKLKDTQKAKNSNKDDDMADAKRREKERGPSVATAVVAARPRHTTRSQVETTSSNNENKKNDDDMADAKRRERERGPSVATAVVARPRLTTRSKESESKDDNKNKDDDEMAEAKRREKERGPSVATATFVARSRNTNRSQKSECKDDKNNDDDMAEAKRREKERGPSVATAVVARSRHTTRSQNAAESKNDVDDMAEAKRLERERGPATASATAVRKSTVAASRSTQVERDEEIKRREKEMGPANATAVAKRTEVSRSSKENENHSENDESSSSDSAYALAMARSSMQNRIESEKLKGKQNAPTLAPATSGEQRPGAASIVGEEIKGKKGGEVDYDDFEENEESSIVEEDSGSDDGDDDVDIEAQAGVPLVTPGAFAVQGLENSDSEYSSSDEDVSVLEENSLYSDHGSIISEAAPETPDSALQAELYEEVVVEGIVATAEDEEESIDPKSLRRLRMIQFTVFCLSMGAIGLITGTVLGLSDRGENDPSGIEGWAQVGPDVFGPTEEPLTLFGSAVRISGDGKKLVVATPGTDNSTDLNVGQVYIMQELSNDLGTDWSVQDILDGPGPSTEPEMSLALSNDASVFAVGFPRLESGSRVQLYDEIDGLWTSQDFVNEEISEGEEEDWFGHAVDLSDDGNVLAVGSPLRASSQGSKAGAVQIYQRSNSTGSWIEMGNTLIGEAINEYYGWSISLQRNQSTRIAIGAPVSFDSIGLVRVVEWTGSSWTRVGNDIVGTVALNRFGESVSLSANGSVLAVGARGTSFETGQVQVFRFYEGTDEWVADSTTFLGDEAGEGFGASVSLSNDGNVLVVGAPRSNLFGDGSGVMKVYKYDETTQTWNQDGSALGSADVAELGVSVDITNDGNRVVGGAPVTAYVGSVSRAGSAQVYDRSNNNIE